MTNRESERMMTATVWVRGPHDINWRVNARFHRPDWPSAYEAASRECRWYARRGYRTYIGPEAPEMHVPGVD